MSTLAANVYTLADWAKTRDPQGRSQKVAELLQEENPILEDMVWQEGNLPTGHQFGVRTSLPEPEFRRLNEGTTTTKDSEAQVTEHCGILEDWSEVDKDVAELNGDLAEFRFKKAKPHLEGLNQKMAATFFYGNHLVDEKEFTGIAPRYATISNTEGENMIDAGGSGGDNTSIYLVGHGPNSVYGIFPKGSKAGVFHEDLGLVTIQGSTGIGGTRMRAYQDHWQWKAGLCVEDWRFIVRIGSIDKSVLQGDPSGSTVNLLRLMTKAYHRLPSLDGIRPVFYCSRAVFEMLDIQAQERTNVYLTQGMEEGTLKTRFRGIKIKPCDQILHSEALI